MDEVAVLILTYASLIDLLSSIILVGSRCTFSSLLLSCLLYYHDTGALIATYPSTIPRKSVSTLS